MPYQKVCKQGKEDIKIKISMQRPIPTSSLQCKKNLGIDEALYNYLQLYIIPSLWLHTFLGMPSLHLLIILSSSEYFHDYLTCLEYELNAHDHQRVDSNEQATGYIHVYILTVGAGF